MSSSQQQLADIQRLSAEARILFGEMLGQPMSEVTSISEIAHAIEQGQTTIITCCHHDQIVQIVVEDYRHGELIGFCGSHDGPYTLAWNELQQLLPDQAIALIS